MQLDPEGHQTVTHVGFEVASTSRGRKVGHRQALLDRRLYVLSGRLQGRRMRNAIVDGARLVSVVIRSIEVLEDVAKVVAE
jgi:hypothetical protein